MNILSLLTKTKLENIIKYSFSKFKSHKSYIFLDLLKCYGFFYATDSGTSISIEDLKFSSKTLKILNNLKNENLKKAHNWKKGFLSQKDRFEFIMTSWSEITEDIKDDIVQYFEIFDPLNSLFIMSNSGARGNMSQVRQLIGVRGLMSDQNGNIIDVPVNACFKNGLSPIDYIISAYGARKGVVDTAVKTAAAGYLTRRLIFLARNFLIKQIDCKSKNGVIINVSKTKDHILYGYTLLDIYKKNKSIKIDLDNIITFKSKILNSEFFNILRSKKKFENVLLKVRSILTCTISSSLCQKCYGIDYSTNQLITLGEVVGIIAAQSIGEPGTQLTMRTFHTGGVFSIQKIKELKKKISGKILLKNFNIKENLRNKKNNIITNVITNCKAILYNYKGDILKKLSLNSGLLITFKFSSYIYNLDISDQNLLLDLSIQKKKLRPLIIDKDYKILKKNLTLKSLPNQLKHNAFQEFDNVLRPFEKSSYSFYKHLRKLREQLFYNSHEGLLLLTSGQVFDFSYNYNISFYKNICSTKKLGFATLSSVNSGICLFKNKIIILLSAKNKKLLNIGSIHNSFNINKNLETLTILHFEKYRFLDSNSILLSFFVIPKFYKKLTYFEKFKTEFFIFNIYISFIENFYSDKNNVFKKKRYISTKKFDTRTKKFRNNDFKASIKIITKNGLKYRYFKKSFMLFPKSILVTTKFSTQFIAKSSLIGYFITQTIQGNDIVQGIPTVSKAIEAIKPKFSAILSCTPGIKIISSDFNDQKTLTYFNFKNCNYFLNFFIMEKKICHFLTEDEEFFMEEDEDEDEHELITYVFKEEINIFNGSLIKSPLVYFNKKIWFCENKQKKILLKDFIFQKESELYMFSIPLLPKNFNRDYVYCIKDFEHFEKKFDNNYIFPINKKKRKNLYSKLKTKLELLSYEFINKGAFYIVYDFSPIKILLSNSYKYKMLYTPLLFANNPCFLASNKNLLKVKTPLDLYNFLKNETNLEKIFRISLIYLNYFSSKYFDPEGNIFFTNFIEDLRQYYKNCINLEELVCKMNLIIDANEKEKVFKKIIKMAREIRTVSHSIFDTEDVIFDFIKESEELIRAIIFIKKYILYIFKFKQNNIIFLKNLDEVVLYSKYSTIGPIIKPLYRKNKFVNVGEPISNGFLNPHYLLQAIYIYNTHHYKELNKASIHSINKFQLILLNSILAVYQEQNVKILIKHIEIMCKQLSNYTMYNYNIDKADPFFPGQVVERHLANLEHNVYLHKYKGEISSLRIRYYPSFISVRKSITDNGFLSSASFQNVRFVLTKGALYGIREFCSGLKERIISGKTLNAGTNLEYKRENILNNKQFYKFR
jgi:hypothetical protein